MTRFSRRLLVIAAAGLMAALPLGWAEGESVAIPNTNSHQSPKNVPQDGTTTVPYAVQAMPCGKRTDVVKMLRDHFGESPIAHGLANTGAVAEVFISAKGSWTIVATSPNGMSCMVGSGESWAPVVARDGTI